MGLFDFLGDLVDIAKDIVMLPVEVGKATTELVQDLTEVVTQDISNKVSGTPDAPIRTSFDVRDSAEKIIETVNNDFYNAKEDLKTAWSYTSQKAKSVAEKRKEVYQLLGQATSTTLQALPEQPFEMIYPSNAPYIAPSFDVGTSFGVLGTGIRMGAAEEYLQQAKEYRANVRSLINKVHSFQRDVLNIADAQTEELEILNMIQTAYQGKSSEILIESAKILQKISVLCAQEMRTNTDKKYSNLLQNLKIMWY